MNRQKKNPDIWGLKAQTPEMLEDEWGTYQAKGLRGALWSQEPVHQNLAHCSWAPVASPLAGRVQGGWGQSRTGQGKDRPNCQGFCRSHKSLEDSSVFLRLIFCCYMYHVHAVPAEAGRGQQNLWNLSYLGPNKSSKCSSPLSHLSRPKHWGILIMGNQLSRSWPMTPMACSGD